MFLAKWSLNLYSLNSLKRLTHVFNFTIFLELWISCPLLFMISALLNFNRKMKFTSKSEHDWVPAKYLNISFTIEEKNSCDSKIFCYPWKKKFLRSNSFIRVRLGNRRFFLFKMTTFCCLTPINTKFCMKFSHLSAFKK